MTSRHYEHNSTQHRMDDNKHVSRDFSETIIVSYSLDQAIRFFTAQGEMVWIPDWDCQIIRGDGFNRDDVFISHSHDSQVIFVVNDYSPKNGHVSYTRIVSGMIAGTIEINLSPVDSGTSVEVIYRMTSLSPEGIIELEGFSEESYTEMIKGWGEEITKYSQEIKAWLAKVTG